MDCHLLNLVPDREWFLRLSGSEHQLLEFALDQFGEPLSRLLFSGLGEDRVVSGWLFTVTFTGGQEGVHYSRKIRVVADYRPDMATSVPRGKEPLVLLALLRLLLVDREFFWPELSYDQEEVLKLLGWEDVWESQITIDKAVKRYTTLYYEWALEERELEEANLSFFHSASRFILGYRYETIEEDDGVERRTANHVQFDVDFLKELIGRSLFGINWDNVSSLERL